MNAKKILSIGLIFLVLLIGGFIIESNKTIDLNALLIDRGEMIASWYGPGFHGRKTASGEVYDQMAYTAAHKTMRFGTLLKITNPDNGKYIIVRINDRGPYIKGRDLDLSKYAASELGMIEKGVTMLEVKEIDSSPRMWLNLFKTEKQNEEQEDSVNSSRRE